MDIDDLIEIGTIVGASGLKGEVRVNITTDFPERFEKKGQRWLTINENSSPQAVEFVGARKVPGKNIYVVKLDHVNDRTQAENLKGAILSVHKGDRPHLEEDEYHVADLIGLEVYNQQDGENIGVVVDVFSAAHDILEVKLHKQPTIETTPPVNIEKISRISRRKKVKPKKTKELTVLIPFVAQIVPMVDIKNKKLEINPPLGLLDN
ncbi:ribosome maturation factor RimM [Cyanobacterium stanieri LEGE 03274]|uniref:Ribosome maturation factor RimM n=1 Tax=Cyanobacterium stanieri LEGE 03274 TaxID=1828756 RepID=A0ABR9V825_9CHRO|nr:ribosome maturation factor RimM [Cyanobacterium stanieri]MBE9223281.1 ribosome maturation factor RimM [Cyanobacterium stanieri LEGE 03274]